MTTLIVTRSVAEQAHQIESGHGSKSLWSDFAPVPCHVCVCPMCFDLCNGQTQVIFCACCNLRFCHLLLIQVELSQLVGILQSIFSNV